MMKALNLILTSILTLMFISCSSDNENEQSNNQVSINIVNISSLYGYVDDEIIIEWETNIENVTEKKVFLNNIEAEIIETNNNSLTFKVPNSTSGYIKLVLNGNNKLSSDIFNVLSPPSITINSHVPSLPKNGYEMQILGSGFGTNISDISVIFKDFNDDDISAKILNLTDTSINVAVPVTAKTVQSINVLKGNESITYSFNLKQIEFKRIHYYTAGQFKSVKLSNDLTSFIYPIGSGSNGVEELYSIAFDSQNQIIFGQSTFSYSSNGTRKSLQYRKNLSPTVVINTLGGDDNDGAAIYNSNTGKKYLVKNLGTNTNTGINESKFQEINNDGVVIGESNIIEYQPLNTMKYVPYLDAYVDISSSLQNLIKINPITFEINVLPIINNNFSFYPNLNDYIITDLNSSKIYVATNYDIIEIDLNNFTANSLGTNFRDFIINDYGSNVSNFTIPTRTFYYEPTNEIFTYHMLNNGIYAVNLTSKTTRKIPFNPQGNFWTNRIYGFVITDWYL